jgi:dTDP-glucose pyrophosphorylase
MQANVVIPMAGSGSRFEKAGYTFPKPLIEVYDGVPMIQEVVNNIIDSLDLLPNECKLNFFFLAQEAHIEKFKLDTIFKHIFKNISDYASFTVIPVKGITQGAASTTLLAEPFILDKNIPLIIANSDQIIEGVIPTVFDEGEDAVILSFKSLHPKWSFVKVNEDGIVTEVAEKDPISDDATVGIYCWKRTYDYFDYAKQMISNNIRVNNEFYVCPVFNEAIKDKKTVTICTVNKMIGLGTPEDLNNYKIRRTIREELEWTV